MDNPTKLFNDITKLAQQLKLPGVDMDAVLKGRRQDVEALLEVGRIAQGGASDFAQKQAATLRALVEDLRNVLSSQPNATGTQLDAVRQAADNAINNVAELAQIVLQPQFAAFDTVWKRAQANIDELKSLAGKTK